MKEKEDVPSIKKNSDVKLKGIKYW